MNFEIKKGNINYTARFIKLGAVNKHPNADRLQFTLIEGNSIITGLDAKEGDFYVYFPLGCAINFDYLSYTNSFQNKELNFDKTQRGFFNDKGVVKATRLRSQKSEGYIVPAKEFCRWLNEFGYMSQTEFNKLVNNTHFEDLLNIDFDSYKNLTICKKYVNPEILRQVAELLKTLTKVKSQFIFMMKIFGLMPPIIIKNPSKTEL